MANARLAHTATVLPNGSVLVTGGNRPNSSPNYLSSTEIFNPDNNTWSPGPAMSIARRYHTATRLPNGKVLITGGETADQVRTNTTALYDPQTQSWSNAASMVSVRARHTATLLANGKVLVAGGGGGLDALASAELYDPQTNAWSSAGSFPDARFDHTATLVWDGRVLITGGGTSSNGAGWGVSSAAVYNPTNNSWTPVPAMSVSRFQHQAIALSNGKVLVIGGRYGFASHASTELFDPNTNTWTAGPAMSQARAEFAVTTLVNGSVLVVGGSNFDAIGKYDIGQLEMYRPETNTWAGMGTDTNRYLGTATLLGNGDVLIAGGLSGNSALASVSALDYFGYVLSTWDQPNLTPAGWVGRTRSALTVMPDGKIRMSGGRIPGSGDPIRATMSFDPATGTLTDTGWMECGRASHTETLLGNGKLLIAGGQSSSSCGSVSAAGTDSAHLLDIKGNTTAFTNMGAPRVWHNAIRLGNGNVLLVGGNSTAGSQIASLFDVGTATWSQTGPASTLAGMASVLLTDGRVLVTGGIYDGANDGLRTNTVRIYDPANKSWTTATSMLQARAHHFAVLLRNGKVLVAGGTTGSAGAISDLRTAELFDPATQTWSSAGSFANAHYFGSMTVLPNGEVLLAGGSTYGNPNLPTNTTEVYHPSTNTWYANPAMAYARYHAPAILMPNAQVLIAGGSAASGIWTNGERYSFGFRY
jgi:N-acetylneuraminic acid mutarotase